MIQVEHIVKIYKKHTVLDHVSLDIEGIYGLLGSNGAGKTTLMKIVCGLTSASGGDIRVDGRSMMRRRYADTAGIIGFLPQDFNLYPSLPVEEVLSHLALLQGIVDRNRQREVVQQALERVNLSDKSHLKMEELSGGMRRRVGIAQLLLREPKILVFDEPTAGLDIEERIRFRNLLRELSHDHTIIISSHIVEDIEFLCTKIGLLSNGRLLFEGTPDELKAKAAGALAESLIHLEELNGWVKERDVVNIEETPEGLRIRYFDEVGSDDSIVPRLADGYLAVMRAR
ncbi:ATP-binding cassette domain-containing protein [Exiguobacterium sp.]|uniref:ATP-binding cassette domain-containing protein n=1 Tax=Exiguobacterium sp. TaxID=44751 RepID=UPI00263A99D1|nr:ATP-binding cassette domain-containing protein [Exiguobacterium sp.]MCC5892712.1 ATP-binding cassette domain-containing protein [Exiguobacterium sp.]